MGYKIKVSDPRCKFSASHFLYDHDKCSRLHGHNYSVNIKVSGKLNEKFFVIDFYKLKSELMSITTKLDHLVLIPTESQLIKIKYKSNTSETQVLVDFNGKHYEFPRVDVCLLPLKATTAELLAKYIHGKIKEKLFNLSKEYVFQVEVAESEGSIASYME